MIRTISKGSLPQLKGENKKQNEQIEKDYETLFENVNIQSKKTIVQYNMENQSSKSDRSQVFEQIDNVLVDNHKNISSNQFLLKLKIDQLEKFCQQLSKDNKDLSEKVQEFIHKKQTKVNQTIFIDEFSQLNNDFLDIETLLKQYRTSLSHYQNKIKQQINRKDQKILQLAQQVQMLREDDTILRDRLFQMEKINKEYTYRLDVLQREIKISDSHLLTSDRLSTQRHRHLKDYKKNNEIEEELEVLIQQLMAQLQYQRGLKKKMQDEIKRLGRQLLYSQESLKDKSNKVYSLEIILSKYQKSSKQDLKVPALNQVRSRQSRYNSHQPRTLTKTNSVRGLNNFSLAQLLNNQIRISNYEKFCIIPKILQYYKNKMNMNRYSEINPEHLLIFNYQSQHLNIISIRQAHRNRRQQLNSLPRMLWNMAINILNLLNSNTNSNKTRGQQIVTKNMLDVLEGIVKTPEQQISINNTYFDQLNEHIEEYLSKQAQSKNTIE